MRNSKTKSFFEAFTSSIISEFVREDYKFIIVGYPYWRAYVTSHDEKFRIEVYPKIDVRNRTIEIPKQNELKQNQSLNDEMIVSSKNDTEALSLSAKDLITQSHFFDHIPEELIHYVIIFKDSHWELIKALTYFGEIFRALLKTNPALGYLIVNMENLNHSYSFYNHLSYIEHLITDKQKEILGRAGFPESDRLVKIFSKIEPRSLEISHIKNLRNTLLTSTTTQKEKILKILSHSKVISARLIDVVSLQPSVIDLISGKCLSELVNSGDKYEKHLKMLTKISAQYHKWHLRISVIENVEQLKVAYDKQKDQIKVLGRGSEFPPPPLPDNEYIFALKSPTEMRSWAIKQRNCIRKFIKDVKLGNKYFYKVIYNGEEATLEIKTGKAGIKMGELHGKGNGIVSKESRSVVNKWFNMNLV
ncbi:MAG TPA: hypothetical protein PLT92_14200 [Ignavibacteriaceae bacterium]|nr:hypothetical protein [Ignavibacteriaceae bacterium]